MRHPTEEENNALNQALKDSSTIISKGRLSAEPTCSAPCSHHNAYPYFGPVHKCPDCGEMPVLDICKPGKQWR